MTGKRGAEASPGAPVIRTVRILKGRTKPSARSGAAAHGSNLVTRTISACSKSPGRNGKKDTRGMVSVSMIEAVRRSKAGLPVISRVHPDHPDARFLFSLSWGETVHAEIKGIEDIFVYRTSASTQGQIYFTSQYDARPSSEATKFVVKANTLNGKKVTVDRLGRIRDAHD